MTNVKPGDRVQLTAFQVNEWNKTAEAYRAGKFQSLENPSSDSPSPVVITIQNKTGKYANVFSVLSLGESINLVGADIDRAMPDGINKNVAFEGNEPAGDETVCITLNAIHPDALVSAVISGAVGCVVDVVSIGHRYAVPVYGDITKLQSSESGIIKILNPLTETGEQFCYVLLGGGGTGGEPSAPRKARLVQPKELFPACEYKSLQNVGGCSLEYSDDNENWTTAATFDIAGRVQRTFTNPSADPHRYWRINLKGFSKPETPNDDRGFQTYGRLWEAAFGIKRKPVETKKFVTWQINKNEEARTEYTFTAHIPENWSVNSRKPLVVELSISPVVPDGELLYKSSTGKWKNLGAFSSTILDTIPAEDIQITLDKETGKERYNTSFSYRVEQTVDEYNPDFNEAEEESKDNPKFIPVTKEVGNLAIKRPTYKLSPERPSTFTTQANPVVVKENDYTMTTKVESLWKNGKAEVSAMVRIDPPIKKNGRLYYRAEFCSNCIATGISCAEACQERKRNDWEENNKGNENYEGKCPACGKEKTCAESCYEWKDLGEISQETRIVIPADDLLILPDVRVLKEMIARRKRQIAELKDQINILNYDQDDGYEERVSNLENQITQKKNEIEDLEDEIQRRIESVVQNTFFEFVVSQDGTDIISVQIPNPLYPITSDAAEVALPPPRADIDVDHLYFDSKPVPRKAQTHRYWTLAFDQPEVVTKVLLDVDQHKEHYIVAPGGRDAEGQARSLIDSFDFDSEKWTATTFPEMRVPMFNMDAKIAEITDKTHNLVVLSGQTTNGLSGAIQGYNFEKNQIQQVGSTGLCFAGRPALWNPKDSYSRSFFRSDEQLFSGHMIVLGGGNSSTTLYTTVALTASSAWYASIFAINPNDFIFKEVHPARQNNATTTISGGVNSAFTTSWSVTFAANGSGTIGNIINEELRYTRHQSLPVRGIRRQRPVNDTSFPTSETATKVVDFLLIGGFNTSTNTQYNNSVVSGMLGGSNSMSAKKTWSTKLANAAEGTNRDGFLYYPDSLRDNKPYILGDCCAEYIEERDEIICFGGRATESDLATAHKNLAVLEFSATGNTATWNYQKYPDMPHPRWSAASVLIKDLVRKGETEACTRIFIIGGRNTDGFVPEMDVFNLRYNRWEPDWKGLDQGEQETIPTSLGGSGATIVIGGGGSDCKAISNAKIDQILQANGF